MGQWTEVAIPGLEGTDWTKSAPELHRPLEAGAECRSTHPGLDPEWLPGGYQYRDDRLELVHTTSVPTSLEQALEYFKLIDKWGLGAVYIERREPLEIQYELLPYQFDPETQEAKPLL